MSGKVSVRVSVDPEAPTEQAVIGVDYCEGREQVAVRRKTDRPMKLDKNKAHRDQHAAISPERITVREGVWYVDPPRPDWYSPETWRGINPMPWRVTDPGQVALLEACKSQGAPLWVNLAHGFGNPPVFTDQETGQEP